MLPSTALTNWVLYARGEFTEGDGNLKENGGTIPINDIGVPPIHRETDDSRLFQTTAWRPLVPPATHDLRCWWLLQTQSL